MAGIFPPSSAARCNYFPRAAEHLHRAGFSGEDQSQPLMRRAEQDPFTVRENREEREKNIEKRGMAESTGKLSFMGAR